MTDEAKAREQMRRGERAAIVLKELEQAFEDLEKQCFETFRRSDMHDEAGHRSCRYYLRILDDIKSRFERFVIDGQNAEKALIRLKGKSRLRSVING